MNMFVDATFNLMKNAAFWSHDGSIDLLKNVTFNLMKFDLMIISL
jgi:hypothetical protein